MKNIGLLITIFVCAALFFSCGDKTPVSTTPPTGEDWTENTSSATEELPDIPLSADFGGENFYIYSAGNVAYEDFTAEETDTTPLEIAQYRCRQRVETDYNIRIVQTSEKAYSSGNGPGFKKINTMVNSGECPCDLALIAGYDVTMLGAAGMLYDLKSIPDIHLEKSWWDQNANESLEYLDVLFYTTGDITCSDNNAAYVIMFNKNMLENYSLPSPYEMVYSGDWDMENFKALCKAVTEDLDQNDVMDENDRFGLLVWVDSNLGMVHAAGQRCCVINGDQIELTLYNETTLQAVEQYLAFALDKQHALQYQAIHNTAEFSQQLWAGDHGLFWTTTMGDVQRFRETESDFGLLPYPKLTKEQDRYYSTITPFNSQFICVPLIQNDVDRTGLITEALAYYGQKEVLPAYYEVNLKGVHSRDEESLDMIDIIFDNLVYDIGFFYQIGPYNKHLNYMVSRAQNNFASMYDSLYPAAQAQIANIQKSYAAAAQQWHETGK